jgi:hypothetical protein
MGKVDSDLHLITRRLEVWGYTNEAPADSGSKTFDFL